MLFFEPFEPAHKRHNRVFLSMKNDRVRMHTVAFGKEPITSRRAREQLRAKS